MLRRLCRLLTLAMVLPLTGCVFGVICRCANEHVETEAARSDKLLPPVQRGGVEPGYHSLSVPLNLEQLHKQDKRVPHYRGIGPFECQCLAAAASSVANLLDEERRAIDDHAYWCPKGVRLADLKGSILLEAALEARNESAGAALEIFYRLGEAETRWELLQDSIREIDNALAHTKELARQGIRIELDVEELRRQRAVSQAEATQLQLGISRYNSELRRLLNFEESQAEWRFWPCINFEMPVEAVSLEKAIHDGLSLRPQLRLLRTLPDEIDAKTLPAVQSLLKTFNGLMGMSEPQWQKASLLLSFLVAADRAEVEKSRRQIQQYYQERERAVVQDIQQAVRTIEAQIELVVLARERVRIRREKLANLEDKQAKGITPFSDIMTARLELLRARDDVVKEVTALKLAQVKLKHAQGALAAECGCGGVGLQQCHGQAPDASGPSLPESMDKVNGDAEKKADEPEKPAPERQQEPELQ